MKNTVWLILTAGFAMFSMFFGSGNLVFPIQIGVETTSAYPYASLGLLLTGVIIPFLGVLSLLVHRGTTHSYFALLGRIPGFIIVFMMLSLMGPFGVGARCIIVAYGGLQLVFENMPFLGFAIGFSVLTGLLTWKKNQIVSILGKYLTPILLVTIFILVIAGLFHTDPLEPFKEQRIDAFLNGLNQGYQTMDLLAAFFFSAAITEFFKNQLPNVDKSKHVLQYGLAASCVGILLLAIVYFGFVKLGASYSDVLSTVAPEKKLVMIASLKLGSV
ncbi:MAG: branched-chain amino acid transport system II carrier protein, partial [Candidatus Nucleicultricaceae bacterium]